MVYTEQFFNSLNDGSLQSAREVVPFVMKLLQPKRVVDVGCGLGAWLSVFQENGIQDFLGMDGEYINTSQLCIPLSNFLSHDLRTEIKLEKEFDLAMSLEVAEHLPNENAEDFVELLTSLAPVVLFSAAVPYQPGDDHVNTQWLEYWMELFKHKGYIPVDCLRMRFWQNQKVKWWYAQNALLFVKESHLEKYPLLKQELNCTEEIPPSLIHPELYLLYLRTHLALRDSWDFDKMPLNKLWLIFKAVTKRMILRGLNIFSKNS